MNVVEVQRHRMTDFREDDELRQRRIYARRVIENPTGHYLNEARYEHNEVEEEWIERAIVEPYHTEIQEDGRVRYWGAVPEAGNWVRVVVAEDRLHTAFLDGNQRRRWGIPT